MNRWFFSSALVALALAAACSDDGDESGNNGGSGGSAGSSAGQSGSSGTTGEGGGSGGQISCDPPPPPISEGGTGGMPGGEGGGAGVGGGAGGEASEDGSGGQSSAPVGLAIAGSYVDDFDGEHVITSSQWQSPPAVYHISQFDNDERWVVALNDEGNSYNPCRWSRFDWVVTDDGLYFCTTAYDAESEAEALAKPAPDASDPAMGGCNNFPWSKLTPQ